MKEVLCDGAGLEETARALLAGGVAVIPTDTVYGLAAHPARPEAVARLYDIKRRAAAKPVAMLASSAEAVEKAGFALEGEAKRLAAKYWPGALTLVVEDGAGRTEGFRVPAHDWCRALIEKCGGLLRVTSANLSGCADAASAPAALASVGLSADVVADGGPSPIGAPSTVVRVRPGGSLAILRPGPVGREMENGEWRMENE